MHLPSLSLCLFVDLPLPLQKKVGVVSSKSSSLCASRNSSTDNSIAARSGNVITTATADDRKWHRGRTTTTAEIKEHKKEWIDHRTRYGSARKREKKRQSFNKWLSDRTCELWAEQMWTLLHSHSLTHSLSLAVWPLPANSSQYDYADAVAAAAFCLPPPLLFLLMGTTADRLTPSQDYLMTYSRSLTLDLLFFPVLSLILFFLHFLLLLFPYSHLSLSSLCVLLAF